MNIGVIGNNASKFTPDMEKKARLLIRELLFEQPDTVLVSGRCHQGGIDIWAEEEADALKLPKVIHEPDVRQWNPPGGYGFKARNLDIAGSSDEVNVVVAGSYLFGYEGRRFDGCYHCARAGRPATNHVKSGACWTLNEALRLGKTGGLHIIEVSE